MARKMAATSLEAYAAALGSDKAGVLRIYKHMVAAGAGGKTRDEISRDLDMYIATVCARVAPLLSSGLLLNTGVRRRTQRKRSAFVLKVNPHPPLNPEPLLKPQQLSTWAANQLRDLKDTMVDECAPAHHLAVVGRVIQALITRTIPK